MLKSKRRSFSAQFKADAAALVTKGGKSVSAVAKHLGVADGSLRLWIKQSDANAQGGLSLDERTELMELRKRLKRVEMERDILKKATVDSTGQRTHRITPQNVRRHYEVEWPTRIVA